MGSPPQAWQMDEPTSPADPMSHSIPPLVTSLEVRLVMYDLGCVVLPVNKKRGAIPLRMAEGIAMLVVVPRNTCTCMKSSNINKQLHTNCKLSRKIFAERQQLASRGLRAAPLLNISSILNLLESSKGTCKLAYKMV